MHNLSFISIGAKKGLANELSQDGACERAIFPDSNVVATRCTMIANLTVEGVSSHQTIYYKSLYKNLNTLNLKLFE